MAKRWAMRVLHQADQTGNLQAGKYADFLVAGPRRVRF